MTRLQGRTWQMFREQIEEALCTAGVFVAIGGAIVGDLMTLGRFHMTVRLWGWLGDGG